MDNNVYRYVIIGKLQDFIFSNDRGTEIVIPNISLNTQESSSVRLAIQGMMYLQRLLRKIHKIAQFNTFMPSGHYMYHVHTQPVSVRYIRVRYNVALLYFNFHKKSQFLFHMFNQKFVHNQ
jgi:hypothetical protein